MDIKAGLKVVLKDTPLYANASCNKVSKKKSGTFYIWKTATANGRIRVTDSETNVGKAGLYIGWINIDDIPEEEESKPMVTIAGSVMKKKSGRLKGGDKIILKNTKLFIKSDSHVEVATKTGPCYIWSGSTANGRIRITNTLDNVNKAGKVTGWINVSDLN